MAESTRSALIFGPNTVSNAWNHWLFINSTAYIDQSNDGFYAHMEKWNPEDLFIYRPQYLLLRTYLMINSTWLSWLYCQPFSLPDSGTGALAKRAGHLLNLPVLSDRPTVFVKTAVQFGLLFTIFIYISTIFTLSIQTPLLITIHCTKICTRQFHYLLTCLKTAV